MEIAATDYKADAIKGKQRCHEGGFVNALGGIPSETYNEEIVTVDETTGRVIHTQVESCSVSLTDPAKALVLRNPADDSVVSVEQFSAKLLAQGSMSYEDYFMVRYSMYRQTANERDAARAVEQTV